MVAAMASARLCGLYTPPSEKVLDGVEGTRQPAGAGPPTHVSRVSR
jgi:hypothetical protein